MIADAYDLANEGWAAGDIVRRVLASSRSDQEQARPRHCQLTQLERKHGALAYCGAMQVRVPEAECAKRRVESGLWRLLRGEPLEIRMAAVERRKTEELTLAPARKKKHSLPFHSLRCQACFGAPLTACFTAVWQKAAVEAQAVA